MPQDIADRMLADLTLPRAVWARPPLIATTGLPCTGKTECAAHLAARYPLVFLSTDAIRPQYDLASGPDAHAAMYAVAGVLLPRRVGVLFDGIHLRRRDRDEARDFARRHGATCELLYATTSPVMIDRRLAARLAMPAATVDAGKFVITPAHYARIAQYLEEPTPDEVVWTVETSTEPVTALLAPLCEHLDDLLQGRQGG